ncbi:MAG: bifunctional DNA primase/polymerase [Planctomycetia bacterium]|nr:bifunctional DNA primase/polymerase [Planctomycetia bacterium]
MLPYALEYAARGWPVFPLHEAHNGACTCGKSNCKSIAKHPRTPNGVRDATVDEAKILQWFKQWPTANIGIATGAESGIGVIDIDPRHGGDANITALEKTCGPLPATVTVKTGSDGRHGYFQHHGGEIRNARDIGGARGVDVRGDGGYVVAPPSIHANGNRYEWIGETEKIAELPEGWRQLLSGNRPESAKPTASDAPKTGKADDETVRQAVSSMLKMKTPADESDGSNRLYACACRAVEHDLADDAACKALSAYVAVAPFPKDWSNAEFVQRIRDAEKTIERGSAKVKKPKERRGNAAGGLLKIFEASGAKLFHDPEGTPFAVIRVGNHSEVWPIRRREFKSYLSALYWKQTKCAVASQSLADALNVLESIARHDSQMSETHVRIAGDDTRIILDLADTDWRAVEITAEGWRILDAAPVRFRRPRGMLPLPTPERGGAMDELREFINCSDSDWALIASWNLGAIRPARPYAVMNVNGEQGSGKTTACQMLRAVLDPNVCPLRAEPKEPRDLAIAASNAHIVAIDNVSKLQAWLSDGLCRLATGGGFSTRELFSDDDEKLFNAKRPIVLNGIEDFCTRSDLIDRAISVTLPTIPENRRRPEAEIWRAFEAAKPRILGAFLDAAAAAIRKLPTVKLATLPRMADFCLWSVAGESGLALPPGSFLAAFAAHRRAGVEMVLEHSPIYPALRTLAESGNWTGTASELLERLADIEAPADPKTGRRNLPHGWPKGAPVLGGMLRRLAPDLRRAGIDVALGERANGSRQIRLELKGENAVNAVTPSRDPADGSENGVLTPQNVTAIDGDDSDGGEAAVMESPDDWPPNADSDGDDSDDSEAPVLSGDDWGTV